MNNIAIVFWSATGNTEAMADAVKLGAQEAGAEVSIFTASDFSADMVADFDAIAFGCPAMGDEVLEEDEFQPMFDAVLPSLNGKKVALFGSYGWGDGQWMRDWQESCQNAGVSLACDCVIANDAPDDEAVAACKNLGAALV
ncbi:flavodoxin [Lachnoclostridium sp. MSJ-17]|uniref:flavodoxin n=1 Tax=Lachnoclostridium sp. MSJ-17 TaxID=2841516 RepID=UPI001C0FD1CC|nr:flavodoxin [Lachnoclostridium sp. MSJ-17]MBU5461333.1 flavodoxin [Lachnoclostridium sp. MSJ-17]